MWSVNTSTISNYMRFGLTLIGIWPGGRYRGFFRTSLATMLIIAQIFQFQYMIAYFKHVPLTNLMDALSMILSSGIILLKLMVLWINERIFQSLLTTMNEESQMLGTEYSNNLMTKTVHFSHYLTNRILAIYPCCSTFYAIGAFAYENQSEEETLLPRKLIWTMKLPFNYDDWPFYEITLTVQFLCLLLTAAAYGTLSCLLLTMILHVGCQIDILCQEISEISTKKDKQFGRLIQRHQEIIVFIENIEQLFTYIALMQLMSNTVTICCIGFLMVTSIGTENTSAILMRSALFYIVVVSDAFVFCFAGEYLSTKTAMIASAAYESLWYDLEPAECRIMLVIILRSQKELTISIGKVTNLSLNTFASILKASMSYISVLLAIY